MQEAFDSRLELVVLEGGGQGNRHPLDQPRVTLGRQDPGDEPAPGIVAFPDPTVSRVHAHLEWDARKLRYVLEHRSRTNFTVVNGTQVVGPQVLEPGDLVKLGKLVLRLERRAVEGGPRSDEGLPTPVESDLYLVCLQGPARGAIFPLNYSRLVVRQSAPEGAVPGVFVPGAGDAQGKLAWVGGELRVRPAETGRPLKVLRARPGFVVELVATDPAGVRLDVDSLLVAGEAVLVLAPLQRAGELREALRGGAEPLLLHPLLPGIDPGSDPCWKGDEEFVLRVLSGLLRGSRVWIRPRDLVGPVTLGPAPADLELPERRIPRLAVHLSGLKAEILNLDEQLGFNHNWDPVTSGEEVRAVSGDRLTLGRTVVAFEHVPTQARVDALSLFLEDAELPLMRQVNTLGYDPQSDLRVDDRRLGGTHGVLEVRESGIVYRHRDPQSRAAVGERTAGPGEELPLAPGDTLVLLPDLQLVLGERRLAGRPGDHILIGPTREELEAEAGEAGD